MAAPKGAERAKIKYIWAFLFIYLFLFFKGACVR